MAKLSILKGSTSVLCRVFIQDSSSTTGAGLTGLVYNTSSLVCYRGRDDDGAAGGTSITLASATRGTWTSGGFVEKDATNMPGWYEFGIPNNALATGSRSVNIHFKGAANMAPLPLEIELTGFDNQSTSDGGLSKLTSLTFTGANKVDSSVRDWVGQTIPTPNQTGVPITDDKYLLGTLIPTPATAGILDVNVKNVGNQTASASGTITFPAATLASTTGPVGSVTGNVGGNVTGSVGSVVGAVGSVTAPVTVTGVPDVNVSNWKGAAAPDNTGDAFARIGVSGVGLTNLGDARIANLDATISSRMATFTVPSNFGSLSVDANGRVKTQTNITKNAALAKFQFVMRDSTSHAPAPGKTVTVTRSIDNGSHGAGTLSAVTEIGFGTYSVDFAAADLNGNVIVLRATAGSCDDTFERIVTTP